MILLRIMRVSNLKDISEVIGTELAVRLENSLPRYGRQKWLYVPVKALPAHYLSQVIGMDAAKKLCWAMGGCQMTVGSPYKLFPGLYLYQNTLIPPRRTLQHRTPQRRTLCEQLSFNFH